MKYYLTDTKRSLQWWNSLSISQQMNLFLTYKSKYPEVESPLLRFQIKEMWITSGKPEPILETIT